MKQQLSLSGTILVTGVLLCFACNEVPTASTPDRETTEPVATASKKGGKGGGNGGGGATRLRVEFRDGPGDAFRSDAAIGGSSSYRDREEHVIAQLKGRFLFKTNGGGGKPLAQPRKLCFELPAPVFGNVPAEALPNDGCVTGTFNTRDHFSLNPDGTPGDPLDAGLQDMAVGETILAGGGGLWFRNGFNWFLLYDEQRHPTLCAGEGQRDGTENALGAGFIIVRENETTWTVVPNPESDGSLSAELHRQSGVSNTRECVAGFKDVPFKMTLTDLG